MAITFCQRLLYFAKGYYILPKAIIFCQRLLYFAKGYYILPKAIIFCQHREFEPYWMK
jgi:hypothetical protein